MPRPIRIAPIRVTSTALSLLVLLALADASAPAHSQAQSLPWSDEFSEGAAAWTFVDDQYGTAAQRSGPGRWVVEAEHLRQTSNVWVGDPPLEYELYLGTHAVAGAPGWSDYALNVDVRSTDNDGVGLLVRYQSPTRYYRLLLMNDPGNGGPVQRLERRVGDTVTILAETSPAPTAYPGGWFTLTVDVRGDTIRSYLNGEALLTAVDADAPLDVGRVGLSVYANTGAAFDNVAVSAERTVRPAPPPPARTPYLQLPSPPSLTVAWQGTRSARGRVDYGPTPALGHSIRETTSRTRHRLTLDAPLPANAHGRIYYRAFDDDEPVAPTTSAYVPLPRTGADADRFSFLVFGDSGTGTDAQQRVAAYLNDKLTDVHFGLHVGDVSQSDGSAYEAIYFTPYAPLLRRVPVLTALGNHDTYHDGGATYLAAFDLPTSDGHPTGTERYYAVDYGLARLIVLDTNQDVAPGSAQHTWLAAELTSAAAHSATWRIVVMHHPPYSSAWPAWAGDLRVRQYLLPLFEAHGVDLVFAGHTHSYERGTLRDVTYVTTGGAGGALDAFGRDVPHLGVVHLRHHVVRVDVDGATLSVRATTPDAELLDAFEVRARDAATRTAPADTSPRRLTLSAPFPNPVRPGQPVTFTVAAPPRSAALDAPWTLDLYDLLGRHVARLAEITSSSPPSGTAIRSWHVPPALAAGRYHLRLQVGTHTVSRPLIVR